MTSLTVLYDARCALCSGARAWLESQRQLVRLTFVPAGSLDARRRFPLLNHTLAAGQLTVVADDGAVYVREKGWLMCLWALRDYRAVAARLSTPDRLPVARRFFAWVERNRRHLWAAGWVLRVRAWL